ncbi:lytic transglycosylase domain-containing protein [Burkholderia sp. AU19243]|uniref:lytic transglycosylase domain-containing protein n=1 Tax=Burkholderia TaxID=32008 RepID=UPI001AE993AF|nr:MULTISPECIES: lytic transglycosylase domain-containing protein [Burkholderia]MBR8142116.1 lytic transglycosylase domain-containing protein [Burkholderia vietnamiensis]MBR8367341.1 lytic transglycosylase domain-containing protein [Burkholderia sp. AU19243]QTO42364.1 lytic transglycosylase domain-containing protein [Burkholderia latens]
MTDKHPPKKQPPKTPEPDAKPAYTPLAWSYPFSPAAKEGAASDAADPMTYMKVLAAAEDGFYPLGASGIWHGGIHFGQKTGEALKQDEGVRAIATGEVVAYRLDNEYPTLTYQDQRHALYSRGFVLIRHTLQLPPTPKKTEPAPPPANAPAGSPASGGNATPPVPTPVPAPSGPPPGETLTFFSLYMHTLDWKTYKAALDQPKTESADAKAPQLKPLPYWEVDRSYRALKPNKQDLPKPKPIDPSAPDDDSSPQQPGPDDALPEPVSGVRVRITPNAKLLGLLPEGTELTVNEADNGGHKGWAKIMKIIKGDPVGPVVGQPPDVQLKWGYVYISELEPIPQSGPVDKVVVLKKPYPVKAGDVVAHIGQYQRYREAKPTPPLPTRPLLHLEVFAGPDLPAFIAKSQARAKELSAADPNMDKPFLEVLTGAKLVTKAPDPDYTLEQTDLKLVPVSDPKSRWVKVQPKTVKIPAVQPEPAAPADKGKKHKAKPAKKPEPIETPTGIPFWIDSTLGLVNQMTKGPVKGWKDFPLKVSQADGPPTDFRVMFRVVDLDKQGPQSLAREDKDASGKTKRWWNVTVGTKDGGARQGWVCERDHPKVQLCSQWDWPGFELVDNSSTTMVDMFKRYLFVAELAMGEDQDNFKPSADALATSELIQKLEKAIDVNHDGKVTAAELADAQKTPWLAEAISHIVVKSESEWGGNMGKWEDITPYMKLVPWKWLNEMERIRKLQWWEDVQGIDAKILPKEPKPWHFHPIGLIGNFSASGSCNCINVDEFCKRYADQHPTEFGWFEGKKHVTLPPMNPQSVKSLHDLVTEMMKQYPVHFKECKTEYLAYMLATARIESYDWHTQHFFSPICEGISYDEAETNYGVGPHATEAHKKRAIANGNTEAGDGYKYRGRGLVQLTWKIGYKKFKEIAGADIVANPDLVLDLPVAVRIMMIGMRDGLFRGGNSLSTHLDGAKPDYYHARYIINGDSPAGSGHPDKAEQFQFYAEKFEKLIRETK